MTRNLGLVTAVGSPLAVRASRATWRDPRLWVGVAIVAVSVVVGSKVMAGADDTVAVYAVHADVAAGSALSEADLVLTHIRFASAAEQAAYLASREGSDARVFIHGLRAGELVPLSVLADPATVGRVQLPLSVDPGQVPPAVRVGDVVDIYVLVPGEQAVSEAMPALSGASVVAAPDPADAFVASGQRQLVVSVADADARRFLARVGAAERSTITVVRVP